MAVSFSNTHLRIPEGFSELLMGLSKEVLRDQPEDIPAFAAFYFQDLLKQRKESNLDATQFTEKLRDKFYNTQIEGEIEPPVEIMTSEEKIHQSRTDSESNHAAETSEIPTTQPYSSQEEDLSESEVEEQHLESPKQHIVSEEKVFCKEETTVSLTAADQHCEEPSESENKGTSVNVVDTDVRDDHEDGSCASDSAPPQATSDDVLSLSQELNVCAQELGRAEDSGEDKQGADDTVVEASDSESEGEVKEEEKPTEMFVQSEPAEVDICASELGLTEREIDKVSSEIESGGEEDVKPQIEEMLIRSSMEEMETPEGHAPEVQHQDKMTDGEVKTESEAPADERSEGSSHIEVKEDNDPVPEEESLVEVSFEDVPDFQQTTEAGENQPVDEDTDVKLLSEEIDMQDEESEFQEVTLEEVKTESGKEPEDEPDIEKVEEDEMDDGVKMKEVTDFDLNNDDDVKKEKSVTEDDEEVPDEGTCRIDVDGKDENTKPYVFDLSYETTDTAGDDGEESQRDLDVRDGDSDDGVEGDAHSSAIAQPDRAAVATGGESGAPETSAEHLSEQHQGTLLESGSEKEVTEEESRIYTEAQDISQEMCEEENSGLTHAADDVPTDKQGEEEEEEPELEADSTQEEMEDSSGKQEECSRPQEEEEDIMDIPLDDPEANRAAAKIQAGFRGHMTRKKMKPEDKAEGEEVSSTGDVLNGSQGATATGGTGAVDSDDTSVPEQ